MHFSLPTQDLWLLGAYAGLLGCLSIFALHRVALAVSGRRLRCVEPRPPSRWPTVVVQLPIFNERFVVARVIEAACRLRYPRALLSIQVLDDSTDDTRHIIDAAVRHHRARGIAVEVVRRPERTGFKAGALAEGLAHSDAELCAVLDADFVPAPDFLERLVPHFQEPDVGMVQACWGHLNRGASRLTAAQAQLLDGHFLIEHSGRAALGCFFNFNGTAGVWRRKCIDDAGGWLARTLTEDLDLSYRAQLCGWRFVYRPDVVVDGELPARVGALKSQQHRWAKGAVETALHVLPAIWRTPGLSLRPRVEATFHLLGNLAYPLVLALALFLPLVATSLPRVRVGWVLAFDVALLAGATGSVCAFYWVALRRAGRPVREAWALPSVLALGVGLAVNNTRALVEAVAGHRSAFIRTPKDGGQTPGHGRARYRLGVAPLDALQAAGEIGLAAYAVVAGVLAVAGGQWGVVPFLGLFAVGLLVLGVGSVREWIGRERLRA